MVVTRLILSPVGVVIVIGTVLLVLIVESMLRRGHSRLVNNQPISQTTNQPRKTERTDGRKENQHNNQQQNWWVRPFACLVHVCACVHLLVCIQGLCCPLYDCIIKCTLCIIICHSGVISAPPPSRVLAHCAISRCICCSNPH